MLSADFSPETADQQAMAGYIQSTKRKKPITGNILHCKVIIQI